jgi:hypothetical protein
VSIIPTTCEAEVEGQQSEASIGKSLRLNLKNKQKAGQRVWCKWWSACLVAQSPEFNPQQPSTAKKKKKKKNPSIIKEYFHSNSNKSKFTGKLKNVTQIDILKSLFIKFLSAFGVILSLQG